MDRYDVSAGYKEDFSKARCLAIANALLGKKRKAVELLLQENRIELKSTGLFFRVSSHVQRELALRIGRRLSLVVRPFFKDLKFTKMLVKAEEQKLRFEQTAHKQMQLRVQLSEEFDRILEAPSESGQKSQTTVRPGLTDRDLSFHTASLRSLTLKEPSAQLGPPSSHLEHDGISATSIFSMINNARHWKKELKKASTEQRLRNSEARSVQCDNASVLRRVDRQLLPIRLGASHPNASSPATRLPKLGPQTGAKKTAGRPRTRQVSEQPDLPAPRLPKRLERKLTVTPTLHARQAGTIRLFAGLASRSFNDEPSPTKLQLHARIRGRPHSPTKLDEVDRDWIEAEPEHSFARKPVQPRTHLHMSLHAQHDGLLVQSRTDWLAEARDSQGRLREAEQAQPGAQRARRLRSVELPAFADHGRRGKTLDPPSQLGGKKPARPLQPLGRINRKLLGQLQALNEENTSLKKTALLPPPAKKKRLGLLREPALADPSRALFYSHIK